LTAVAVVLLLAPQWTLQTSGVNWPLRGISAVSENVVWASGGPIVVRTANGGDSWQPMIPDKSKEAVKFDFRDIDAVDERTAYALSIGTGELSRIYKTTDAGESWTLQFTNEIRDAFYDAMAFWDANRGIAVSDSVAGRFVMVTTEDGGRTWTRIPPDVLPSALTNEGYFAASGTNVAVYGTDHVWAATGAAAKARVLRSSDRGKTWQASETPIAAGRTAGIFSIAFRDAQHGIVVGGDYAREGQALDNIAVTSDGGVTWSLVPGTGDAKSPLSGFRSVVRYIPGTTTVIAVGPSGADISTDDGRTWTKIEGPGFHTFAFAPNGSAGWGAGSLGRIAKLTGLEVKTPVMSDLVNRENW
jgi:photosystem II stability/assembly factor-like uncharacterized protein